MKTCLAALVVLLSLSCAAEPFSYQTVRVADGIYAFIEPKGHAVVSGNSVAIVGDTRVVVIDTHWHNDHVAGNSIYEEEFPGVKFVAHAFTARLIDTEMRAFQGPCTLAARTPPATTSAGT